MGTNLKSICIVGGGTAGWMAACLLASVTSGSGLKITLVESPDIETTGVGESTVPSIMDFLTACDIDPKAFVAATQGSFKLGIRFDNWAEGRDSYFHPFGKVGEDINGFDFYQVWLKNNASDQATRWLDHAPCAIMAERERFMWRPQNPPSWTLRSYSYALHLDANLAAGYLRNLAVQNGVKRVEATVKKVELDARKHIHQLVLNNDERETHDFYIDCTGMQSLLLGQALGVGYKNWQNYLPCDRAVAVQSQSAGSLKPYTVASAQDSGWRWRIPLQHRTGNGYVFSSQFCSDEQAVATLRSEVQEAFLSEPKIIPFTTGRREKIWHKNCLALGLSSGFLEPLESTAIHLVYKTLIHFIHHFPDSDLAPDVEQAFNQKINSDYQEVRDFIILHYCLSKREDTPFWRWCQTMPIPDSLQNKIALFRERGYIDIPPGQLFNRDSWCSVFEGMGVRPRKTHPLLEGFSSADLSRMLRIQTQNIVKTVASMPRHEDFVSQCCPSHGVEEPDGGF